MIYPEAPPLHLLCLLDCPLCAPCVPPVYPLYLCILAAGGQLQQPRAQVAAPHLPLAEVGDQSQQPARGALRKGVDKISIGNVQSHLLPIR